MYAPRATVPVPRSTKERPMGDQDMDPRQPAQHQDRQPGRQDAMRPEPESIRDSYRGPDRLAGKVALVTGADSGIGRSVALHFARRGTKRASGYLEETDDARDTMRLVEEEGADWMGVACDVGDSAFCKGFMPDVIFRFEDLDILV